MGTGAECEEESTQKLERERERESVLSAVSLRTIISCGFIYFSNEKMDLLKHLKFLSCPFHVGSYALDARHYRHSILCVRRGPSLTLYVVIISCDGIVIPSQIEWNFIFLNEGMGI